MRPKVASLLARVTGGGRSAKPTRVEPPIEPPLERPSQVERQRRLGGVTADERLPVSQSNEDLLDIPAFLRRQAN
jgi:cell division protein FtsZ